MIGVFSDSHGDLGAFERAFSLLCAKGARRFFFAGGRYTDLDDWILKKKEEARGGRSYGDGDFLADVGRFLGRSEGALRSSGSGGGGGAALVPEAMDRLRSRFVRAPERESLQYLDPAVPRKVVDMLGESLCTVVHDKNDLDREDLQNGLVFVHGKSSEPKVVQIGPRFFVTAGKLTGAADQTCALIEIEDRSVRFSAFAIDGRTLIDRQFLPLGGKTKLSVK